MKRILNTMIMFTALTTVGAYAQGNGSGNRYLNFIFLFH